MLPNCCRIDEPPQRAERVLKRLPCAAPAGGRASRRPPARFVRAGRSTTSLADRSRAAIRLGIEPGPHAVVELPQVRHIADAFDLGQLVAKSNRGVIAQIKLIVRSLGRDQIDDEQNAGRLLLDADAGLLHFAGQRGQRQIHAVLHQHLGHVEIRADLERDRQVVAAVVGGLRAHVEHVLDADHLLLDRRGDRFGHDLARWRRDRCKSPAPSAA